MPPLLGQVSWRAIDSAMSKIFQSSVSTVPVKLSSFALVPPCVNCHRRALSRPFSNSQPIWKTRNSPAFKESDPPIWVSGRRALSSSSNLSDPQSTLSKPRTASSSVGDQKRPRDDLPSQKEGRRTKISKRFTDVMDNLQSNVFLAGQRLNDFTGYSSIEALKKDIEEQENFVRSSRLALRKAKEAYTAAVSQRSASQREVNELLQRKHAWTSADLERFTGLYRSDHANEQAEASAREALAEAERVADEAAAKLSKSILARYHEEQIWSDKIRRMSTWGTWGLMGVNVLLFLVFQIGVEPWRRKRLVKGFEEKVKEALEKEGAGLVAAAKSGVGINVLAIADKDGDVAVDTAAVEPTPGAQDAIGAMAETGATVEDILTPDPDANPPASSIFVVCSEAFSDLFSEREMSIKKIDLTMSALEGAAAGATIMALAIFSTMIFYSGLGDRK